MALTRRLPFGPLLAAIAVVGAGGAWSAFAQEVPDDPLFPPEDPFAAPAGLPRPWYPDDNEPTPAKADLGERLFSDPLLSRDGTVSCATCHPPDAAYADGKPLAVGIRDQVLTRHAPTLINVAYTAHPFWDGRVGSLEEQAVVPILNPLEMDLTEELAVARVAGDAAYPPLFEAAFGDPAVTLDRIGKALATFQRTLLAGDTPFDEWWAGDTDMLTTDQERGFRLFMGRARCSTCHPVRQSHALFTDDDFHATGAGEGDGRHDRGLGAITGRAGDDGKFKTPTLRNVALTAPYMHDGSLATLRDVIDFYDRGGEPHPNLDPDIRPLLLSERDKRDLVAFLKALTSPVLPGTDDGPALMARGEFRAARQRFLRDFEADPTDLAALWGLAEASLGTGTAEHLDDAADRLLAAEDAADSGSVECATAALWLGRVWGARAAIARAAADFARAEAHLFDAAIAFGRAREASPWMDDAYLEGAAAEEAAGDTAAAEAVLTALVEKNERRDADAFAARAALRYRRGLAAARANGNRLDDAAAAAFRGAVADERAAAEFAEPGFDRRLLLARSLHWLGEVDAARDAYVAAVPLSPAARPALTGLASLLAADPAAWTAALADLETGLPDHPQVLWFRAYDLYSRGELDAAETRYERLAGLSPDDPMTRVFLGRIARDRGRREEAVGHFETALRLDPVNAAAVGDWEGLLRDTVLDGWSAVERLDSGYRRLLAVCGDPYMRIASRNNLGFRLREVVSQWASRGRGRMQYLRPDAPPEARRWLDRTLAVYDAAVAEMPADDTIMDLPFDTRWVYAGVLNDAGLMRHYFDVVQDLDAAEALYLRAFRITDGAYMDAYFYNLQFLYGFERPGHEETWLRLAAVARDAILLEDPESESGYAPDPRKRAAAERDFERLRDLLGDERADAVLDEPLPR